MSLSQEHPARSAAPTKPIPDLAIINQPDSEIAEAFRSLRSTVKFAGVDSPIRSVLIADAGTNGQHVITAANLAAALAFAGDNTILLDADLRQPRLHNIFSAPISPGLAGAVLAGVDSGSALVETGVSNLRLLPAGTTGGANEGAPGPSDLLNSKACRQFIQNLTDQADFLVINAPALPDVGDALALAAQVDAVLLLVRSGRTRRVPAQRAKESLERVGARILGVVLTDARSGSFFGD